MDLDPARTAARDAVTRILDESQQNVLGRNLAWRIANAALDAYEDEQAADREEQVAYALLHPTMTPIVFPTRRLAKQYRKVFAKQTGRSRTEYHIELVLTRI